MMRTALLETTQRKRSYVYKIRQYLDNDDTCKVSKQRKSVSEAVASHEKLLAHVVREKRLRSVSYSQENARQWKGKDSLNERGLITARLSCVFLSLM